MSGPGFGLVVGAQTKAASYVVDCADALVGIARNLDSDVSGELSRVTGPYLSVLRATLDAWEEGVGAHVADLGRYTQALVAVDESVLAAEEDAVTALRDAASGFGGAV